MNSDEMIEIEVRGIESDQPRFLDVVSFLYDWNLLYELGRLATDRHYESFRFTRYVYFRTGRPLKEQDRLVLESLSHESPIKLKTRLAQSAAALGAIWVLTQTAEKLILLPDHRRKLQQEVRKLTLENDKLEKELASPPPPKRSVKRDEPPSEIVYQQIVRPIEHSIMQREAGYYIDAVTRRLERSPVRIEDVSVRMVHESNEEKK